MVVSTPRHGVIIKLMRRLSRDSANAGLKNSPPASWYHAVFDETGCFVVSGICVASGLRLNKTSAEMVGLARVGCAP